MDEDSRHIIEWLKNRPFNAVIEWGTDHLSESQPWACSWVDVVIPGADELKMCWVWTIVAPDDSDAAEHPEAVWRIKLPHDLDIHGVYDAERYAYLNEIAVPRGLALTQKQEEALRNVAAEALHRERVLRGGWSPDAVNSALARWAVEYANRADLMFQWKPGFQSEFLLEAKVAMERIDTGKEETYDIGDGISASAGVMDFLLADPERAAHLMEKFKRILGPGKKE
jgi:hypothetical protein